MAWFNRLANILRPTTVSDEIDEELRYHIDARIADSVAAGMSRDETRADAIRRFGNATVSRERSYEADVVVWLETILRGSSVWGEKPALQSPCKRRGGAVHGARDWCEHRNSQRCRYGSAARTSLSAAGAHRRSRAPPAGNQRAHGQQVHR